MATSVTSWDAQGNPLPAPQQAPPAPTAPAEWDASGNPIQRPTPTLDPKQAKDASDALIYSNLVNIPPGVAYQNHDSIAEELESRLGNYAAAGWSGLTKESIIGELLHGQIPEPFENQDQLSRWIEEFGRMAGDLPFYIGGTAFGAAAGAAAGSEVPVVGNVAGAIGGGAGGFGLTAYMRKALVNMYAAKKASSFDQILSNLKAGGEGALTGAAFGLAGEAAPLAEGTAAKLFGPRAYKAAAELATMTTVGAALEGRVPSARDFVDNAAMFAAMHVGTLGYKAAGEYLRGTYVTAGVHPVEVTANPDSVAPPVEQGDAPVGALRPAIKVGDVVTPGEPGETHDEIQDKMVEEPKAAAPEASAEDENVPPPQPETPEPERGFVDPKGNFLDRKQAGEWVEQNEPEVFKAWQDAGVGNDLHSADYNEANREVWRGGTAPKVQAPTPEVGAMRRILTKIRDGAEASKFGEALRTFFVGNRDARVAETNQLVGDLRKLVPDYRDQEALSLLRDFKNRPGELEARRAKYEAGDNEALKKLIPIIDRALNPSPAMLEADKRMTDYFESHLAEGKKLGFLDSSITNEEYITHLLRPVEGGDQPETSFSLPRPAIGRHFRFAQERTYPTILDALETGKVKAQTLNAFDAMTIYGAKHATAAATKLFVNELKESELGKWGFKRADNIPAGWVELAPNSGLFRNIIPYIDKETGDPQKAFQMLMVPPKVRDAMAPIIEGATVTGLPGFKGFRAAQAYIKAAELGLSVFHMKALQITSLNNEGLSRMIRSHATDMDSQEFRDQEVDGVKNGLVSPILGRTVEAYRAVQPKTFPSRLDVIRELPGFKQVDELAAGLTRTTFDVMQRKFKVMDYSLQKAAWLAEHKDASADEIGAAKRSIAKEVNAAYGGLNWETLGASKNFRAVAQAILLAPDWTFSNILNVKYAFEKSPGGSAARAFWVRSALTGMAMTQMMSQMVSGQASSHPTEVYLGKDKDGKEVYGNYFFAGAPKDAITFLNNVSDYGPIEGTVQSIAAKLSPITRTVGELVANRDWMGRQIVKKGTGALEATWEASKNIVGETAPVPFSIVDITKMLTDTTHDYGPADYISVIGGAPPRHVLPAGVKPQRAKKFSIRGAYR